MTDNKDQETEEPVKVRRTKKGSLASIMKKLLASGKKRGFITYDEINEALPSDEFDSEKIEDAMSAISEMGIQLVEKEDDYEDEGDAQAYVIDGSDEDYAQDDSDEDYIVEESLLEA